MQSDLPIKITIEATSAVTSKGFLSKGLVLLGQVFMKKIDL